MAKFRTVQREGYKKALANARYLKREAEALYKSKGVQIYDLKIPTLKQLEKMPRSDAVNTMRDIRNLKKPSDLVQKRLGGGALVSAYEEKKIKRQYKQSEERRAERRELIPAESLPGLMGSEYETQTKSVKVDIGAVSQKEFEAIAKRLERETSEAEQERLKDVYYGNYLNAVNNVFGDIANLDEVWRKLTQIPYDVFDAATAIFEYLTLDFIYDTMQALENRYVNFLEDLDRADAWARGFERI